MSSTSSKTSGFLGKPNLTPHGEFFANLLYMCCASYGFSPRNCPRCGVLGKVQTVPGCATKNNLKGQTANCLLIWKLSTCSWPDSSGVKQNQKHDCGMTVYCVFSWLFKQLRCETRNQRNRETSAVRGCLDLQDMVIGGGWAGACQNSKFFAWQKLMIWLSDW